MADFADQTVRTVDGPVSLADYIRGLGASDFRPVGFVHTMAMDFALPSSCLRVVPELTREQAEAERAQKRIAVCKEGDYWIVCFLRWVPLKVQVDLDYTK